MWYEYTHPLYAFDEITIMQTMEIIGHDIFSSRTNFLNVAKMLWLHVCLLGSDPRIRAPMPLTPRCPPSIAAFATEDSAPQQYRTQNESYRDDNHDHITDYILNHIRIQHSQHSMLMFTAEMDHCAVCHILKFSHGTRRFSLLLCTLAMAV